jgi:hypothetical protein
MPWKQAAAIDAFKHINSVDDRKMAVSPHIHAHVTSCSRRAARTRHCLPLQTCRRHPQGQSSGPPEQARRAPCVPPRSCMRCLTVCVPPATVYDDLAHPPATYLGPKYAHRMPDGSYNNICDPTMGKAEEPYARSVQQQHALPNNMLPDAGLVFDTLLKREKVHDPVHLAFSQPADVYAFSSSGTRPDFPASCFRSRRLSSIRKRDRLLFHVDAYRSSLRKAFSERPTGTSASTKRLRMSTSHRFTATTRRR